MEQPVVDNTHPVGTYEMSIRFFGNEIFAVGFKTSDSSNRAVLLGAVAVFSFLVLVGAYGTNIVDVYKYLTDTPAIEQKVDSK